MFSFIRNRLSLRLSLVLFLVIPLIGICGIGGFYSLKLLEERVETRMQKDIELIARAIRGPLEYALEQEREGSLSQALDSVFRFERVYGAYVFDTEG
ncbi:MAG: two-component sensor histidine kinase, partial [bacterium]